MLQQPSARKHALPIRFEIASCLVVHDFEGRVVELVDSVDPTSKSEAQPISQLNDDRLSLVKRLRRSLSDLSERNFQADRRPRFIVITLGFDKQLEIRE